MNERSSIYNSIYIKRSKNLAIFKDTVKAYMNIAGASTCSVEDIRSLPSEDKYVKVNMEIINKKRQVFSSDSIHQSAFAGFVLGSNDYLIILSVTLDNSQGKRIYEACFQDAEGDIISLFDVDKLPSFVGGAHFQEVMPQKGSPSVSETIGLSSFFVDREEEILGLPDEANEYVKENINNPKKSIKTLVTVELGKIICKRLQKDSIIIKSIHEGGHLSSIPVVCNLHEDDVEQYIRIKEEYIFAHKCDACTKQLIESRIGYDYTDYTPVTFEFFHDHMYDEFLKEMTYKRVYYIKAYEFEFNPLLVKVDMIGEKIVITYNYDASAYSHSDISAIHEEITNSLLAQLRKYFAKKEINDNYFKPANDRRFEAAIRTIKKVTLFSGYEEEEIERLADCFMVKHSFMQQEIISEGDEAGGIYIPVSGKIEMCSKDEEMIFRPLMLLKPGDVMGIESILSEANSKVTYRVESNDSILLYFDKKIFMEEVANHNELLIKLLDIQSDRLNRFQRLWLLN